MKKKLLIMTVVAIALTACSGSKKDSGEKVDSVVDATENVAENPEESGEALLEKVEGLIFELDEKNRMTTYTLNFGPDHQMLLMYGTGSIKAIQFRYTPEFLPDRTIKVKEAIVQETGDNLTKQKAEAFVAGSFNIKFSPDLSYIEVSGSHHENMNGRYKQITEDDWDTSDNS